MKILDEYIMYIQWHWYYFIDLTGEWLVSPAIYLGPFDNVVLSIGHVLMFTLMLTTCGYLVTLVRLARA